MDHIFERVVPYPIYLHSTLPAVVVCYVGLLWLLSTVILHDDLLVPERERDVTLSMSPH